MSCELKEKKGEELKQNGKQPFDAKGFCVDQDKYAIVTIILTISEFSDDEKQLPAQVAFARDFQKLLIDKRSHIPKSYRFFINKIEIQQDISLADLKKKIAEIEILVKELDAATRSNKLIMARHPNNLEFMRDLIKLVHSNKSIVPSAYSQFLTLTYDEAKKVLDEEGVDQKYDSDSDDDEKPVSDSEESVFDSAKKTSFGT